MSAPSQDLIAGLIRLQRLDDEIFRIQRRLSEGPRLVERRTTGFRQAQARLDAHHDRIKHLRAQVAERELELKSREGEIQRLATQQGTARTNQEYRAFADQMDRIRKDCSAIEDRILEGFARVEEAESDEKALVQARDEAKSEADQIQASWEKDAREYEAELATAQARRAEFQQSLPNGPLRVYERILTGYHGKAVVPAEGKVCGGCQMTITPNDLARLRAASSELITCRSCSRILYFPDLHPV